MNATTITAAVLLAPGLLGAAACLAGHHTARRQDEELAAVHAEFRTTDTAPTGPPRGPGDPLPLPAPAAPRRLAAVIDLNTRRNAA